MGDYSLPVDKIKSLTVPTLVVVGAASFDFFGPTAKAIANAMPNAEVKSLEGQEHNVDPTVLGPVLAEFFGR
jgi:pimeloyl-ACP methyl ester carboxylesterase